MEQKNPQNSTGPVDVKPAKEFYLSIYLFYQIQIVHTETIHLVFIHEGNLTSQGSIHTL